MQYTMMTKVIDNDPKGKSGVGTVYQTIITDGNGIIVKDVVWGLLEEINGTIGVSEILESYREANKQK